MSAVENLDHLNWYEGSKGEDCNDPESREWCDNALRDMGYVLPEDT